MFKLFILFSLLVSVSLSPANHTEIVISAGTELTAENSSKIDSGSMKVGDDANFNLAKDVAGVSATIPAGSLIYGRVVDVKSSASAGESHIVIMFDFLKVGEEFYSISAYVTSASVEIPGLQIEETKDFYGGTKLSMKGREMQIEKGNTFLLKVAKDVSDS